MKAILVIDMPTSCIDCKFTLAHICEGGKQPVSDIKGRHESCPLKPYDEKFMKEVANDYRRLKNEID